MADDEQPVPKPTDGEVIVERRSIDPQVIYDGATAFGIATGGAGGLLAGAAKFKETFFSGNDTPTEQPQQQQQAQQTEGPTP